jgi:phage antirepressor YoqD-like protein
MGRNTLFSFLREIKFIQQKSARPYQSHIDAGHCEVKMVPRPHNEDILDSVCIVTMQGQAYIAKKLVERDKLDKAEVLLEKTVTLT